MEPCRHVEPRRGIAHRRWADPGLRLLRPCHLRSDDPGHRSRHLVLDPRAGGRPRPILPSASVCFPIIGYILAIRRPDNAISWLMLAIGAAFGLSALVGSLRELRDQRRRRRGTPGRDRARVRPADVVADRRSAGDVPDPALPRRAPAVAALAVVRLGPRRQHGDHLPGDPVRAGTVRGERVPERGEPARLRGAAAGAGGRHAASSCCRSA